MGNVKYIPARKYKAANYVISNNIDTKRLARRLGLSHERVKYILYDRSIQDRFTAMAFAYALNCDFSVILDDAVIREDTVWKSLTDSQK